MDLFEYRANQWYETLDLQMRLHGPIKAIKAMRGGIFPRANANRVLTAEVEQIIGRISSMAGWYRSWAKNAAGRVEIAEQALQQGIRLTARLAYLQAAYLYFYGQLYVHSNESERADGNAKMIDCYRNAAPLFEPEAERVEISFRDKKMPGYLRVPRSPSKVPCLVMLGGADTVKEECHYWSDNFIERGVATLTLDGPGQGETQALLPMSADYEMAISTGRKWLESRSEIDSDQIGLWGCSTGGYLAARVMAQDSKFKLGVSVGGFYDARRFPDWPAPTQEAFQHLFWIDSLSQIVEYMRKHVTLSSYMEKIKRPFLIVHGVQDHLVPMEEIEQMANEASGNAELWAYEDGTHSLWNKLDIVGPLTADWVARHLLRRA